MNEARSTLEMVEAAVRTVVVGQQPAVRFLVTAVFAGGHVLLEGTPGLGKTLMVTTLRDVLQLTYSRIQFTPDLTPADITGTNVIAVHEGGEREFRFEPGPIFANLVLADEINRASPKTQSALLQAMQEREVTVFGKHFPLQEPFITAATQNPIDMEGTYPLPESQLDRFLFKIVVVPPDLDELKAIGALTTLASAPSGPRTVCDREGLLRARNLIARIPVAEPVLDFAARLVLATQPERQDSPTVTRTFVRYGASPRALQGLLAAARVRAAREGRFHVSREDVIEHVLPVLRHRVLLSYEGELQRVRIEDLLSEIVASRRGRE